MKIHMAYTVENRLLGYTKTGTLCGRSSGKSEDGTNSTGNRLEVTCKFCLHILKNNEFVRVRRVIE